MFTVHIYINAVLEDACMELINFPCFSDQSRTCWLLICGGNRKVWPVCYFKLFLISMCLNLSVLSNEIYFSLVVHGRSRNRFNITFLEIIIMTRWTGWTAGGSCMYLVALRANTHTHNPCSQLIPRGEGRVESPLDRTTHTLEESGRLPCGAAGARPGWEKAGEESERKRREQGKDEQSRHWRKNMQPGWRRRFRERELQK